MTESNPKRIHDEIDHNDDDLEMQLQARNRLNRELGNFPITMEQFLEIQNHGEWARRVRHRADNLARAA